MASKRPAPDCSSGGSGTSAPPAKKNKLQYQFEPVKLGPVYALEELDIKVLQFQNRKLAERIEERRRAEADLLNRIEELELRQTTDDTVICIVNRYWNQLDEDVRVLLQRFDAETAEEEHFNQGATNTCVGHFLTLLSQWTEHEVSDTLSQRVEFSKRAIGKLLQAYDRLLQRNERLWLAMRERSERSPSPQPLDTPGPATPNGSEVKVEVKKEKGLETGGGDNEVKPPSGAGHNSEVKSEVGDSEIKQEVKIEPPDSPPAVVREFHLSEEVKLEMDRMVKENRRLHDLMTELQARHHKVTLQNSELQDRLHSLDTRNAELKNQVEELHYDLDNTNMKVTKLDNHLVELQNKLSLYSQGHVTAEGQQQGVPTNKFTEVASELEEQRELATNRLTEMEKLQKLHEDSTKEIERLKMELATLPDSLIRDTTEYKCLQSQFSVLYNESLQLITKLDESRTTLAECRAAHETHVKQMEADEFANQRTQRQEMISLEDQMAQVRREYEMLRIEFEQTLAANEQTGPINREMRNLISSLKSHNDQIKGELQRYKKKLREGIQQNNKLKAEVQLLETDRLSRICVGEAVRSEDTDGAGEGTSKEVKAKSEAEIIKDLRTELKKTQDNMKELKLLLDMYKTAPKDNRDKVVIMASEKKLRSELEDARAQVKRLQDLRLEDIRKPVEEEIQRRVKKLEDHITELQRLAANQKQEEEALLSEIEVTGHAFEDMQEQNMRLLQQLREKDDANFKLMSERIKWNQVHRMLREEVSVLEEQVHMLSSQVEAEARVRQKLEEKEAMLEARVISADKELIVRQQLVDTYKRKAVESTQTATDLKLHLEKYHAQLKETQTAAQEKTATLQSQSFKYKRLQEEVISLRRKLEQSKKLELASSADEVLQEEIREYKVQLTCPSCKVNKKDAILTKCFHVFCFDCLKRRYETRQRKCPKCNAAFGANDYHRIYLE